MACYPEEVSSTVLGQGKETGVARLGQPGGGGHAAIAVPACLNDSAAPAHQ